VRRHERTSTLSSTRPHFAPSLAFKFQYNRYLSTLYTVSLQHCGIRGTSIVTERGECGRLSEGRVSKDPLRLDARVVVVERECGDRRSAIHPQWHTQLSAGTTSYYPGTHTHAHARARTHTHAKSDLVDHHLPQPEPISGTPQFMKGTSCNACNDASLCLCVSLIVRTGHRSQVIRWLRICILHRAAQDRTNSIRATLLPWCSNTVTHLCPTRRVLVACRNQIMT
jgi:hypothetical protein